MKWYWKILIGLFVMLIIGFFRIDYITTSIVEKEVEKARKKGKEVRKTKHKKRTL